MRNVRKNYKRTKRSFKKYRRNPYAAKPGM